VSACCPWTTCPVSDKSGQHAPLTCGASPSGGSSPWRPGAVRAGRRSRSSDLSETGFVGASHSSPGREPGSPVVGAGAVMGSGLGRCRVEGGWVESGLGQDAVGRSAADLGKADQQVLAVDAVGSVLLGPCLRDVDGLAGVGGPGDPFGCLGCPMLSRVPTDWSTDSGETPAVCLSRVALLSSAVKPTTGARFRCSCCGSLGYVTASCTVASPPRGVQCATVRVAVSCTS
jgi:hypothetical protein